MKRWLVLAVAMLLAVTAGAWAEDAQSILTAETWVMDGSSLTLLADGTGKLTNAQDMTFDITWTAKGSDVTYTFDFYGKHTVELTLGDQDGVPALALRDGSATWYPQSRYAELAAASNADLSLYSAALGEEINLGFVKMRFTGAEVTGIIGGDSMWYPASDGMQFFCLVGHVENSSGMEVGSSESFNDDFDFDDQAGGRAIAEGEILETDAQQVWATQGGLYYHWEEHCSGITGAVQMDESAAVERGQRACPL